jgi:hypothetical protein
MRIAELIKRGEFPRPVRLSNGSRAKAWLEAELVVCNISGSLNATIETADMG